MDARAREVLDEAARIGADDLQWKRGRAFSLAYYAGPEIQSVADEAMRMYGSTNGLNAEAFPSLRRFQSDVVATVAEWISADPAAAGFMTSGGTESILLAVKAARERGRREFGIGSPNVVLPTSAHAAFEKACHYFGVESRRVDVGPDWRADPTAMERAVDERTVLVVASAPQYPQGVVDPVPEIASIANRRDINCHVDACMGGVTLTFLERLGESVPPWDFRVPGVTSISVDLHKYGYSAKGASVVLYRDRTQRSYQTFATDNWLGGLYGSSGILGTKSGGPMAAAWAVMRYLGDEGYLELTRRARRATGRLVAGIGSIPHLRVLAEPDTTLVALAATSDATSGEPSVDVFAVADALRRNGWYVDRQSPPPSLHCTVNAVHDDTVDDFVVALDAAVDVARRTSDSGSRGSYGTVE